MSVRYIHTHEVAIASGQTQSAVFRLDNEFSIVAIETDANWPVAGTLTPSSSMEDRDLFTASSATVKTVRDETGTGVSYTLQPSSVHLLSQSYMLVGSFYRLTAGSAPGANTTVKLHCRPIG